MPRRDHNWITIVELIRFHKNESDEMPCKLNFTENPNFKILHPTLRSVSTFIFTGLFRVYTFESVSSSCVSDKNFVTYTNTYTFQVSCFPRFHIFIGIFLGLFRVHKYIFVSCGGDASVPQLSFLVISIRLCLKVSGLGQYLQKYVNSFLYLARFFVVYI